MISAKLVLSSLNVAQSDLYRFAREIAVDDPDLSTKLLELHDRLGDLICEFVRLCSSRHPVVREEEKAEEVKSVE